MGATRSSSSRSRRLFVGIVSAAIVILPCGSVVAAGATYTVNDERSSVRVHVGKSGAFSFAGHRHEIQAPVSGRITADPANVGASSVDLTFPTARFRVLPANEPAGDPPKVEEAMRGPGVLESSRFPEVHFRSKRVTGADASGSAAGYSLQITGDLTIHGVSKEMTFPVCPEHRNQATGGSSATDHAAAGAGSPRAPRPVRTDTGDVLSARRNRRQRVGEVEQEPPPVPGPRAAVHAGERPRLRRGQLLEERPRALRVGEVVHALPHRLAGPEDVALGDRRVLGAGLSEEVAAQQRARRLLEEVAALPRVRQVRSVEPAHPLAADAPGPRRPRGAARGRSARSSTDTIAATWLQSGCACGAAASRSLSAPHSSASTCEKAIQRRRSTGITAGDRLAHEREHPPGSGVEEQRLVVHDQVLVEAEAPGHAPGPASRSGRSRGPPRRLGFRSARS